MATTIELRIGRTLNGSENGLYINYPADMTIGDILKDCIDDVLRRGYDHWLNKITLQLWRDARTGLDLSKYKVFVHNNDVKSKLGDIVDEIIPTLPPQGTD